MQLSNKTYDLQKKLPKCQMTPQYLWIKVLVYMAYGVCVLQVSSLVAGPLL